MNQSHVVVPVHKPSSTERIFFFISGIVTGAPFTLFVQSVAGSLLVNLSTFDAVLISAVLLAPFLEEFAKAFPLLYRHGETQRSIFSLGFLTGLGFGVFEFVIYVFVFGVPIVLRLPGILFHAASTSITAYGIATKKPVPFYLTAVGLHLANNISAFLRLSAQSADILGPWSMGAYLAAVATYLLSWYLYNKTSENLVK